MKRVTILLLLFIFLIPATVFAQEEATTPAELCAAAHPAPDPESREFEQAEQVLTEGVDYHAVLCTSTGPIYVDLFEEQTPVTVNNFVFLAQQGYYNNTNFHRVIQGFMAQAGDPSNTGAGGPGYEFEDEIVEGLGFDRPGLLAMANAGPGTNGSQFFITTAPTDWLNGAHTIFGEVLAGQQVVENIRLRDPQLAIDPGESLDTIIIVENPGSITLEEPVFTAPTVEDAEATFENLSTVVPTIVEAFFPGLSQIVVFELNEAAVFMPEEAVALVSEENQAIAAEYYNDHNLQYSALTSMLNKECQLADFPVQEISYKLDAYATPEDAAAAFEDERLVQMLENDTFSEVSTEEINFDFVAFQRTVEGCDGNEMAEVIGVWQQGYVIVTGQIMLTPENASEGASLIPGFVQIFYNEALYPLLRPHGKVLE